MAGGTWNRLVGKERPGTYINFKTTETNTVGISDRGTVIMPLLGHNYGPSGEFITVENSAPDGNYSKLGYSVFEPQLLLVKEALKCAKKVILYIPTQGEKARAEAMIELPEPETDDYGDLILATVKAKVGAKSTMTGCNLTYDRRGNVFTMILTGDKGISGVKDTGIVEALATLINGGYTVSVGGVEVTDLASVQKTTFYAKAAVMKRGDSDISAAVKVSKDDQEQDYTIVFSYPSDAPEAQEGLQDVTATHGAVTGTAMYGGERGNDLCFDCVVNEIAGYDVTVYLDNNVMEIFEGLRTVGDLMNCGSEWIKFMGQADQELSEFSGISLTGGTDGSATTQEMTKFLDASEALTWNTMAWPIAAEKNSGLMAALVSKIKYLRDDCGKYRKAVISDYACDYEGIINVVNSYVLSDGTALTHAQSTAWVAGADAGADCVTSNTGKVVEDAKDIVDLMTNSEIIAANKAGKFLFIFNEANEVVVEYDINSLTSYGDGKKAKSWRKNRVMRVLDTFGESIMANFPPNRFSNDEDGWDIMEGLGQTLLKMYGPTSDGGIGAIRNVDLYNDFLVDRTLSQGDETYFNVGIQPVDSAEKLFFTITTR